jgi:hypothetical protein
MSSIIAAQSEEHFLREEPSLLGMMQVYGEIQGANKEALDEAAESDEAGGDYEDDEEDGSARRRATMQDEQELSSARGRARREVAYDEEESTDREKDAFYGKNMAAQQARESIKRAREMVDDSFNQ